MTSIDRTPGSPAIPASPQQSLTPQLLTRIRSEFSEMPGLRLTLQQARRLLNLDTITCAAALSVLEAAGFLAKTREGAFVLSEGSAV
jgi:hypothetical protein